MLNVALMIQREQYDEAMEALRKELSGVDWVRAGTTIGDGFMRDLDVHLAMTEVACAKHAETEACQKEFQEIALLRLRTLSGDIEAQQALNLKYEIRDMLAEIKCA